MSEDAVPSKPDHVRLAWADDAVGIGAVQHASWAQHYATLLPASATEGSDAGSFAVAWEESLLRPPSARHRVLVALRDDDVAGFAAMAPNEDADATPEVAEVLALHVHPDRTGEGHGSRLLAAVADTLRADGFTLATAWLMSKDAPGQRFLAGAGWSADGATREVALSELEGEENLAQVRWHTRL